MAIRTAFSSSDHLVRPKSFNPAQDWTVCFWIKFNATPAGFISPYIGGDANFINPYFGVFEGVANDLSWEIFDGTNYFDTALATIVNDVWNFFVIQYDAATTISSLYIGNATTAAVLIGSITVDIGAITFVETNEFLGGDDGTESGVDVAYHRVWQAFLTPAQIEAERTVVVAALTTGLVAETTLLQNYDDRIGTNDWTPIGSPVFVDPQSYTLKNNESQFFDNVVAGTVFAIFEINPDSDIWNVVYNISNGSDPLHVVVGSGEDVTVNVLNSRQRKYSGIYFLVPGKRQDTLINVAGTEINVAKPNPFIETGIIRE